MSLQGCGFGFINAFGSPTLAAIATHVARTNIVDVDLRCLRYIRIEHDGRSCYDG